jgi:hypothetical protein
MANSNGKITYPVNQYDVQYVLSINVGGDWSQMCRSDAINKWARFKPLNVSQKPPLTHAQIASNGLHFGLDIIRGGNWNDFKTKVGEYVSLVYGSAQHASIGNRGEWSDGVKYIKPTSWNRITDFVSAENNEFGYLRSAQPLPHWPDYMHTVQDPSVNGVIASEMNGLITGTDSQGRLYIDINDLPDNQILDDPTHIFTAVNTPMSIANKNHNDYNSISILELIKTMINTNGVERGVVLVDTSGFVSDFYGVGSIPWGTWKNNQDEVTLYGEWVYIEFLQVYSQTGTDCCIIPTFENKVLFKYGSSPSQQELAFAKDQAIGICLPDHNYYMYIGFCQITTENLANWDVYVSLIKNYGTASESYYMTRANLSTFQTMQSGSTWYYTYVNVDYPSQSQQGDVFTVKIDYTEHGTSNPERHYYLTNIVLTL